VPKSLGLAVAALALSMPSGAARASIPDRVAQDDATVVCQWHDRARALAQMREGGFSHVRINVVHAPGADGQGLVACALPATLEDYDGAVAAVRAAGLVPQLTLVWYRQTDPAAIATWMAQMAAHFGARVQRFSVLNEPDLMLPASDDCDPRTVRQMVAAGQLQAAPRAPRVKRYLRHPRYRYVSTRIRAGRGHRFVIRRERDYRWVTPVGRLPAGGSDSSFEDVTTVRKGCLRIQRGRQYHRIFDAAEPAIRAAAPGAEVLAGETSPVPGVGLFIGAALPLHADGWAHHCYQWDLTPTVATGGFGIGDTTRVQALVGMPLYLTECGFPNPDSLWNQVRWNGLFTHDNEPAAYAQMWQYAKDLGVREMGQFGWCKNPEGGWDTSLMTQDGCDADAEYLAVKRVIGSWG
jgi:hypothetical protein